MTILNNLCTQALMKTCCGCESGSSKYARASATDFKAGCTCRKASEAVNFLTASSLSPSIRVVNALMTSCMMVWQQAEQSNLGNFLTNSLSMKNQKESRSHKLLSEKSSPRSLLAAVSVRMDLRKMTRYLISLQSMDSPRASSTTSSPNLEKNIVNFDSSSTTASELRRVPSTPSSAQLCSNSISFLLDMLKLCVILICSSVRVLTSRRMKTLVSVLSPSSFSAMLERRVSRVSNCWLVSPQACLQASMREPQLKPVESHLARSVVLMSTSSFQKLRVRSSSKAGALGALAVKYLCFKVSYIYNHAQPNQALNPIIPILPNHHCGNSPFSNRSAIDCVLFLKFFSQTARQE